MTTTVSFPGYAGFPQPPVFATKEEERASLKQRLAQLCRIFDHRGYNETAAGVVSIRDPVETDTFWATPADAHWSLMQPADLQHVDAAVTQSSRPLDTRALRVHAAIYANRPDVICIVHARTPHATAFSHHGRELDMLTQDSCAFYKDNAVYEGTMAGAAVAAALGTRKALFLQNDGALIAAGSVEAAVFFFISCEKCCQVQMLADLAAAGREFGPPHAIGDEEAYETWKTVGTEKAGFFSAWPEFQALATREKSRRN